MNNKITRDIIELDDDVNEAVCEVMSIPPGSLTDSERAELCLGFVSISRHRHQLINCKFLGVIDEWGTNFKLHWGRW